MKKKSQWKSAADLVSELESDPAYVARQAEQNDQRRRTEQELAASELPLVQALIDVGVQVNSVWDLVNTSQGYRNAVPVLLLHLEQSYPAKIREGIFRALAVPEAKGTAARVLLRVFANERDPTMKWIIGNALSVVAEATDLSTLSELVRDRSHGNARQPLLLAISRIGSPSSQEVLTQLLEDPNLRQLAKDIGINN
jgi:hypothetical protein